MALASTARPNLLAVSSRCPPRRLPRVSCQATADLPRGGNASNASPAPPRWRVAVSAALVAAVVSAMPAYADLNKLEADQRGVFGIGSTAQFGSADLNFEGRLCTLMKTSGADLSDTSMDRMVLNEANLTNAVLVRSVLTRSDLGGAIIEGAYFSDAVIDLPQKQALCKYPSGTNPITGVSTRKSLGCGNNRQNAYGSPSSPLLSAQPPKLLDRDGFCDDTTGMCDAK